MPATKHLRTKPISIGPHTAKWCYGHRSYLSIDRFGWGTASMCMACDAKRTIERIARQKSL